jgi:hypothetical protein
LISGHPERAIEEADKAIARWSHAGYHYQHFGHLLASVQVDLYQGEGELAWHRLMASWRELERSMIQRLDSVMVQSHDLRARAAIAAMACGKAGNLPHLAQLSIGRMERSANPWGQGLAALARAGLGSLSTSRGAVEEALARGIEIFDAASMVVYGSVARLRQGQILALEKRPEGAAAVAAATAALRANGIREPEHLADMLAPGRWSLDIGL